MSLPLVRALVGVVLGVLVLPAPAQAQSAVDRARSLYQDARYEEALAVLEGPAVTGAAEVYLYRALCLMALNRTIEADAALALSIESDPRATSRLDDASPRVAAWINDARARLLPELARRHVADGRRLLREGNKRVAIRRFEDALQVLSDASPATVQDLTDLRALAAGFVDLIQAQLDEETAAAGPAATTAPPAPPAVAATPAAEATPPARVASATSRPVALDRQLPPWRQLGDRRMDQVHEGLVRVRVDTRGRVAEAEILESIEPAYDRDLLRATRDWRFTPGMTNGQPVEVELVIPITLQPPAGR